MTNQPSDIPTLCLVLSAERLQVLYRRSRGTFDDRAHARLEGMGKWMKVNGRSIYGCTQAPSDIPVPENCLLTFNENTNRLDVHILDWPMGKLWLDGLAGKIEYAQLLHDGSEVRLRGLHEYQKRLANIPQDSVPLDLPMLQPNVEIPVVELYLK